MTTKKVKTEISESIKDNVQVYIKLNTINIEDAQNVGDNNPNLQVLNEIYIMIKHAKNNNNIIESHNPPHANLLHYVEKM